MGSGLPCANHGIGNAGRLGTGKPGLARIMIFINISDVLKGPPGSLILGTLIALHFILLCESGVYWSFWQKVWHGN
jgi:hypothetical protein